MSTVQGLARLQRRLRAMPKKAREEIRTALEKGAVEVTDAQKTLAKSSRRSGTLIEGIGFEEGEHELQVLIESKAFYSRYVEFGTSHSAAEPFFFPGYRLMKKRVKGRIRYAVSKAAKEAARGQ